MNTRIIRIPLLMALTMAGTAAPVGAAVIYSGCANPNFCTLDELTPGGGGSITVDGVVFSDFINIDLTRQIGGNISFGNTANIQVFGDDSDVLRPTITFVLNGELAVPGLAGSDDAMLDLDFSVATTDASARLTGYGLQLGVRTFTLLDQGVAEVSGDAENPPGTNIPSTSFLRVEEDRRDGMLVTMTSDLFDVSQSSLEGGLDANVFADVANNAVSLETFSYFVTQSSGPAVQQPVPEPASIAVWSLLALVVGGCGWHRRKRQAA